MALLNIDDRTRILHGALQLPTFTLSLLADLTSVNRTTVQVTVNRSRDLLEEVVPLEGKRPEGDAVRFRMRESVRARLAREAVEVAERHRGVIRASAKEAMRTAAVALDAVEASIDLGKLPGLHHRDNWEQRARDQLNLARRLLVLVYEPQHRTPLQRRLVQLAGRLEGTEESAPEELATPIVPSVRSSTHDASQDTVRTKPPRTIWKYPNRRLYDAADRRYITLTDIGRFVKDGVNFVVIDRKGRADITRSILLHIIAEQEQAGSPLLTQDFLAEVIRFYGTLNSGTVGGFLEQTLNWFESSPSAPSPSTGTSADPATG